MNKAFIILGSMPVFRDAEALVGLLFGTERPTGKQLKGMGFGWIQQVDEAPTNGDAPSTPTIYLFDRSPAAKEVVVADVILEGRTARLGEKEIRNGEPHSIIPQIEGQLAQRLLAPRDALSAKDFPKRRKGPRFSPRMQAARA